MSPVLIVLLAALAAALIIIVLFTTRRNHLSRVSGSFDCSLFVGDGGLPGRRPHWRLGVAVYRTDSVEWYPVFTLVPLAHHSWRRPQLEVLSRDVPLDGEQFAVLPGALVIRCLGDGTHPLRLAMRPDAYAGFASWLEAAPPGDNARMGHFT